VEIAVPRARLRAGDGGTREWRSAVLPRYARRTRQLEALIAGAYLAGTNTRRVQRALAALFRGAVGKDVVSRAWRKVKVDWEAWCRRDLAGEDVVRLVLDGTAVRVRVDRKATSISLLVVLGIRPATARRCCWRRATWAGRVRPPGARSSTTWSHVACGRRSS
jgi:transposase-like protein